MRRWASQVKSRSSEGRIVLACGRGGAVGGAELAEGGFDVAAGALVLVLLELVEDRAQEPATWASGMGLDRVVQLPEVEEVQLGGALDRSPQVVDRDDGGEVEERPRDGCDWDPVQRGHLLV